MHDEDPGDVGQLVADLASDDGRHEPVDDPAVAADAMELAAGLERAILAGVAASGIDRPFVLDHRASGGDRSNFDLPGFVRVGSEVFRDAMRAAVAEDGCSSTSHR